MAVEIEAKMKVTDLGVVAARLRERGGVRRGRCLEVNAFYDTEDRKLLASDQGLRVRVARDLETDKATCIVTHKGPNQHGPLKSREETELLVEGAEGAQRLLERLGFARMMSFEKRRESWQLDDCSVELDEVPYLGVYVEVEGPSEGAVMKVREALGLTDRPLIKASYIAMLTSHLQELGDRRTEVTFEG